MPNSEGCEERNESSNESPVSFFESIDRAADHFRTMTIIGSEVRTVPSTSVPSTGNTW
jgi:hypothetical protein